MSMKKTLSIFAAAFVAFAVNAEPVVLPATLDVSNVSFRSEGMPDFVLEEGDYAGTYFDMGAHDSSNDTLLYAEWDVTIEAINYNIAVDVYNENSWRVQLYVLNQAGDTVKSLRYKGSSGQKGQFAIGSIDMSDLEAGDYKVRARAATAWSKMKLKDVIFDADYSGVTVALPGTLLPAYAELSANASITNHAIAFKPSTAPDEYANWNVSFAEAGTYNVSIDITATNGHNYGVELIGEDEETSYGAVDEGGQVGDTGEKELGAITVPAAGKYIVHLTNAIQWSEAVLNSITFAAPAPVEMQTLYLKPGIWYYAGNNEKFAIYAWADGKEAYWSDFMELAENETAIWKGTIPADYTDVIFVRFGNAATTPSWEDNMWNKTFDLKIEEGKDLYTISGWGEGEGAPCPGEWSKYEYIVPAKFYIAGDGGLVGEEKAWSSDGIKVMENSYTFENLAAGNYQFKITIDGTWNTVKGFEDLTPELRAAELYLNGGNIGFTLAEAGDVTITYIEDDVFKVEGAFVLPELQLIGIKGWTAETDAIDFVPADNHLTASVTVTLDEKKDYKFKLIYANSWIGKKTGDDPEKLYVLKNDWTTVDGLTWDGYDIVLQLGDDDYVPGNYTFSWVYATGELTVIFPEGPTAIDNTEVNAKVVKSIENGMLIIIKNGVKYNAQGTIVR